MARRHVRGSGARAIRSRSFAKRSKRVRWRPPTGGSQVNLAQARLRFFSERKLVVASDSRGSTRRPIIQMTMKQVVQQISDGRTIVQDVPHPLCSTAQVLLAEAASLISAGTERYVVDLARKSLLQKARARPDHVARVLQKIRQEG